MIEHIPQAPHPHQSCVFRTKERPNPRFSPVSTRFLPASQILQTLEKNRRSRTPQREKSSTHWKKMDSYRLPSGKNPPDTGRITPPQTIPATQILHPLEGSVRHRPPQRPKSSRHWRKTDAHEPLSGKNPPPTGRKWTHIGSPAGRILQTLEESPRHRPSQRPKSSTRWKDLDAHRADSGKIVPVGGRIRTFTRSLAGRLFQWMEELRLGRC